MSQRTKARTPILSSAGFLLGLSMLLVSCSTTKVNNDYDPSVDFATLKSYAWLEKANPNEAPTIRDNTLLRNRIERSVDAVLVFTQCYCREFFAMRICFVWFG